MDLLEKKEEMCDEIEARAKAKSDALGKAKAARIAKSKKD